MKHPGLSWKKVNVINRCCFAHQLAIVIILNVPILPIKEM